MLTVINKVNNFVNSKAMVVFDVLGAVGVSGYAYYKYSIQEDYMFWAVVAGLSLTLAIVRPAKLLQKKALAKNNNKK